MKHPWLPLTLALMSTPLFAAETTTEPSWKGEGELGYVAARGNTEATTISSKLKISHSAGAWTNEAGVSSLKASATDKKSGLEEETADRFQVVGQSNYNWTADDYLFGSLRYEEDDYSGYLSQTTATVGYGRHFLRGDEHSLKAEIGLGMRESKLDQPRRSEDDAILRTRVTHALKVNDMSRWTNELLVESGEENRFTEFLTGFKFDLNSRLALKLGWAWRNNSEVPAGRDKTDTLTTINLVYGF